MPRCICKFIIKSIKSCFFTFFYFMCNTLYGVLMRFTYVRIKFGRFKEFHGLDSDVLMNRYRHMACLNVLGLLCDSGMEDLCVI